MFRADSSVLVGSGHVMRCLTLACALRDAGHDVVFVCRNYPGSLINFIIDKKFDVKVLAFKDNALYKQQKVSDNYQEWLWVPEYQDAEEMISEIILLKKIDWVIVDHYALGDFWEKKIRKYTKNLMVIDDLANRIHDCDILLDQNYYSNMKVRYANLVPPYCLQLLGPAYALIRDDFVKFHKNTTRFFFEVKKILLFMGGSDLQNMTLQILKFLQKNSLLFKYSVNVILGFSNLHRQEIELFCNENKNVILHCMPSNFVDLMISADLVIGAGGSSVYERCIAGIPSLVFSLAKNQSRICTDIAAVGAHVYTKKIDDLKNILNTLSAPKLLSLSKNAMELFSNYKGVAGVVDAIQSY